MQQIRRDVEKQQRQDKKGTGRNFRRSSRDAYLEESLSLISTITAN